jgi:hypothetical protein
VAAWTSGGWRFVSPLDGLSLYDRSSGTSIAYRNGAWEQGIIRGTSVVIGGEQVVGPRAAPIASPTGGMVVDNESRAAISGILVALRQHGLIDV